MTQIARLAHGHVPIRLPRPRIALLAAFTLALLAPSRSEAAPRPRYAELPAGRVTAPPTGARPASIPAGESVAGIVVTPGVSQAVVQLEDAPGKAALPSTSACFSQVAAPFGVPPDSPERPQEWVGPPALQGIVWAPPHGTGVAPIHVERLTERDGTTVLESTDVWVDPVTRGARLVAKATLPLRQVGSAPGGVKLFAGRDERPDGKRHVQFVVTRSSDTPAQILTSTFLIKSGSTVSLGACGHHRVALPADATGESASVQLVARLPDLPPGELSPAQPLPPPPASKVRAHDVRSRTMRIHMSVSRTTRDKEPLIALSTAWVGAEYMQRTFEPVTTTRGSNGNVLTSIKNAP